MNMHYSILILALVLAEISALFDKGRVNQKTLKQYLLQNHEKLDIKSTGDIDSSFSNVLQVETGREGKISTANMCLNISTLVIANGALEIFEIEGARINITISYKESEPPEVFSTTNSLFMEAVNVNLEKQKFDLTEVKGFLLEVLKDVIAKKLVKFISTIELAK
ncbi:hypothetical protein Aperf_G00000119364 [Anoplocephala perfoliata]